MIPRVRKIAKEAGMIDSVILSLIYGPIAVTLGCGLFLAIEAARANEEVVVRILSHKQRRFYRRCPAADCSPNRMPRPVGWPSGGSQHVRLDGP